MKSCPFRCTRSFQRSRWNTYQTNCAISKRKMLKFLIKAITRILSTNFFAKLLFGVDCSQSSIGYQIGFSTILMKKALKKFVMPNDKVLDIGTGAFAIHGIWLKRNIGAGVVATEIDRRYIESARKVMKEDRKS